MSHELAAYVALAITIGNVAMLSGLVLLAVSIRHGQHQLKDMYDTLIGLFQTDLNDKRRPPDDRHD